MMIMTHTLGPEQPANPSCLALLARLRGGLLPVG
jgi:hypothetical protein